MMEQMISGLDRQALLELEAERQRHEAAIEALRFDDTAGVAAEEERHAESVARLASACARRARRPVPWL